MKALKFHVLFFSGLFFLFAGTSWGQDPIIYPAKGQSKAQMEKDRYDCYQWAKEQSDFDPAKPMEPAPAAQAPSSGPGGERVRGAARGAAVGAVAGAIAGDAGTGAAAGAAGGAMLGGMRKRRDRRAAARAQEELTQAQKSQYAEKKSVYDRAFSACMESKGYTVK